MKIEASELVWAGESVLLSLSETSPDLRWTSYSYEHVIENDPRASRKIHRPGQ